MNAADASRKWETIRGKLTSVEATALKVALIRYRAGTELNLYDTRFDKAIVDSVISIEDQSMVLNNKSDFSAAAVLRTAEIDYQLLQACDALGSQAEQIVILGAGLDTRAWRLDWPAGITVFEVDTGSSEKLKCPALESYPLKAKSRHFIMCDLTETENLKHRLAAAGHSLDRPTVWLLEGLIGYLSRKDGDHLLSTLFDLSAAQSTFIMTCPPTYADRKRAASEGSRLHHSTFEEPESTLRRVRRLGWEAHLLRGTEIAAKYKLEAKWAQTLVIAHKSEAQRKNSNPLEAVLCGLRSLQFQVVDSASNFACTYPLAARAVLAGGIVFLLSAVARSLSKQSSKNEAAKGKK